MRKASVKSHKSPEPVGPPAGKPAKHDITNLDVTLYALHLVGGDATYVMTEDVAVKAFELYPERFGLIKYPQYPDVEAVRMALIHMRVHDKLNPLVEGDQRKGWRVTNSGLSWLAANRNAVELALSDKHLRDRRVAKGKIITRGKMRAVYLKRLLGSRAYVRWREGIEPSIYDFYDLMRVDQYTPDSVYQKHLRDMVDALGESPQLVEFLRLLDRWFGQTYRQGGNGSGKRTDIRNK
jgi:hypothetical protein